MRRCLIALASLLAGCVDLGPSDPDAAREVVYDPAGTPAFAGQALTIQSCGAGNFCHSDEIAAVDRFGAPNGLSFDVRLASTTVEVEDEAVERLDVAQRNITSLADSAWALVHAGRMPPGGAAGDEYLRSVGLLDMESNPLPMPWERFDTDGNSLGPLPSIETEEGREIFRNWLVSGAPVVERTQCRIDGMEPALGYRVPLCERGCVDPTWESIYVQIIQPSCARSRCHDNTSPAEDLDLFVDLTPPEGQERLTLDQLRERSAAVVGRLLAGDGFAHGSSCREDMHVLLTPGDPDASLLYLKVAAASNEAICGNKMPLSGNPLTDQRLCAIREWIACMDDCADEDSALCTRCVDDARVACGVAAPFDIAEGSARCVVEEPCSSDPSIPRCP